MDADPEQAARVEIRRADQGIRFLARSPFARGRSPADTPHDRLSQSAEPAAAAGQEPPR